MVKVPAVVNTCVGFCVVTVTPSPKFQEYWLIAGPPFAVEVEVKLTGTPAQTLSGDAVKFAVGACAQREIVLQIKTIEINILFIGPIRTSKVGK
jgi:hypothetical protein